MKPNHLLWGFLAVSHSTIIHAATLSWDANSATAPVAFDGAGIWTDALRFHDSVANANVTWPTGAGVTDIAQFGNISSVPIGIVGGATIDWAAGTTIGVGGIIYRPHYGNAGKYNIRGNTATSILSFNGPTPSIAMETLPSRPFGAMNAPMAGTVGLDITATNGGIYEIGTQTSTITGGFRLKSGSTLSIGSDLSFGGAGNGLSFDATSTLITRGNTSLASGRTLNVATGSLAKLDSLNGATLIVQSAITGAGGIQKEGLGGLTLNTGSTYAGNTAIRGGTLTLNFANATAPVAPTADIIPATSTLRLLGGTLAVTGKPSTANTQAFSGLTLLPGASSLTSTAGATGGTTAISLGGISRVGGSTLNIATIAAGTSYTTSTPNTDGILGGFGTVNNADWLTSTAGTIGALGTYQTGTDATLWLASDNVSLAATPTVPLAASATVSSLKYTATADLAIPASETLTLTSGGILVTGGAASITGGNLQGSADGDLIVHQHNAANPATIGSNIQNNTSPTALTKSGAGTLVLSGTNTYTNNTFVNAGTLEVSSDANLGGGSVVTVRNGANLRIAGSTAFSSGRSFIFDTGADSYGANGLGGSATDVGQANLDVTNSAGATISGNFNVTAGTLVKNGAGVLTLTHNGTHQLARLNGGMGVIVQDGGIVFNGGTGSEWYAGQAEFVVGAGNDATKASAREASVTVESGKVTVGSWTGISRGNGTANHQSKIVLTGSSIWDTGNTSLGFINGVTGGYLVRPLLDLSGTSAFIVRDDALIAESSGATATINVKDSSQLTVRDEFRLGLTGGATANLNISGSGVASSGGPTRFGQGGTSTATLTNSAQLNVGSFLNIGNGGTATVNVADTALLGAGTDFNLADTDNSVGTLNLTGGTANANTFYLGKGSNAASVSTTRGVVNQSGGLFQNLSGGGGDWRIGGGVGANDSEVYGCYTLSGGNFNSGARNLQIGAFGIGVMDVRGGAAIVNTTGGFPVIGRFAGGFGHLDVSSGSFTVNNTAQVLIVGEAGSGSLNISNTGSVVVNSNPGGAGNGGGTGGTRLALGAGATGVVSLNGGSLETSGIAKSSNSLTAFGYVHLNGGELKARSGNATFMQGLDTALVGSGGAKINTNSAVIAINQPLLGAGVNSGVLTIPVATPGSNYMGPPIVRITGGAGTGATAIANMSGNTVLSVTITNPGTGYAVAPTVSLLGGGTTTPATLGTPTVGTLAADGGLTKSGSGTLTLGGTNTYTGTTAVMEDTLLVTGSVAGAVTVAADCTIGGTGTIGGTLTVDATAALAPGLSAGTLTAGTTVMPGLYLCEIDGANADRLTVNGDLDITGASLSVSVLAGGTTQASYTIASYTGNLTGSFTVSGSLPATYTLFNDVANKEIKLVSSGNFGIWAAGFGLVLSGTGAPDADADSDGIPNALEYVTGGDPTVSSQVERPLLNVSGSDLVLTFNRKDTSETADAATVVEVGTTLNLWPDTYTVGATTGTSTPGITVTPGAPGFDLITLTVPKGADPKKFARVRVTITP